MNGMQHKNSPKQLKPLSRPAFSENVVVFCSDLEYEFDAPPSDVTAVAGRATSLRCRPPASFPPANVTWYKDGVPLSATRTRSFPAEVERSGDLPFTSVQFDDDGRYVCVASNDFAGRVRVSSAPATLTVLGKSQIPLR